MYAPRVRIRIHSNNRHRPPIGRHRVAFRPIPLGTSLVELSFRSNIAADKSRSSIRKGTHSFWIKCAFRCASALQFCGVCVHRIQLLSSWHAMLLGRVATLGLYFPSRILALQGITALAIAKLRTSVPFYCAAWFRVMCLSLYLEQSSSYKTREQPLSAEGFGLRA